MKKILTVLLMLGFVTPGMANEYDTYDWRVETQCPVCDCGGASRDNYTGVRVYKNEHAAYSYNLSNGHKEKYQKDNFGFGTTVGNNLTDYVRVEYETLYMGAQYSKYDTDFEYDIWANMLNAYVLWDFDNAVAPYAGAGVGLTGIWGEIDGDLDNAFDLSYQAMVGILFHLNSRIDLDVGFKYINFGKVEHTRGVTKVDATQLYLGLAYKFGL
ncbi:MAG: porin family protein [Alphaproteobacteria bacterium]|nr:porin family protein [Alphaproteobacteria bacterium]